jgi:multidrug efflux pump subunit AcrB
MRVRPALQQIGQRFGANVKVVEVPPGPPVLSPIVAEIYGPEAEGRRQVAQAVRQVFAQTAGIVDVDDSGIAAAPDAAAGRPAEGRACWACRSRPS